MQQPHVTPRHLMAFVWLCLLVAGCVSQMAGVTGPKPGVPVVSDSVLFVKPKIGGNATWQANKDGTSKVAVTLAPIVPRSSAGKFRIKTVNVASIVAISAAITASDLAAPIYPTGADGFGSLAVVGGVLPALNFPTVPAGHGRILTIKGYNNALQPVHGAIIRTAFDTAVGGAGTFEVSSRTTPAANVFMALAPGVAANTSTAGLQAFIDSATGVSGSYPHTYTKAPNLINAGALETSLGISGGSTTGFNPLTYEMPGVNVTFSFYMDAAGGYAADGIALVPGDLPTVFVDDEASVPFTLPPHAANTAALNLDLGTVAVVIAPNNLVTVTFRGIGPNEDGSDVEVGAVMADDNTPPGNGNPRYYPTYDLASGYALNGHIGVVTISEAAAATGGAAPAPVFTLPALDPKFVAGQVRWRDDTTLNTVPSMDIKANIALNMTTTVSSSSSSDKDICVGPTTSAVPSYALGNVTMAPGERLVGCPGLPEGKRPILAGGGGTVITGDTGPSVITGLHLSGAGISLPGGGTVASTTVEGFHATSSFMLSAISIPGVATAMVDSVHVYDIRNMSTVNATAGVTGVDFANTAGGTISNVLVDDNFGAGDSKAVRMDAPVAFGTQVIGIHAGNAAVVNSQVIRLGYIGALGINLGYSAIGILSDASGASGITGCTVADSQAKSTLVGIQAKTGAIANCEVRNLYGKPTTGCTVMGIYAGAAGNNVAVSATGNWVHQFGTASTDAGFTIMGIYGIAPVDGAPLAVAANRVDQGKSEFAMGINVDPCGGGSDQIYIAGNTIAVCSGLNTGASYFRGISGGSASAVSNLYIQDNDVSNNTIFADTDSRAIQTAISGGTAVVHHNRIAGNTVTAPSGNCVANMIMLDNSGSANTTCDNNIISGNTMTWSTATSSGFYTAIARPNAGSGTNDIFDNAIYSNTITVNASAFSIYGIQCLMPAQIVSNRIFENTYTGTSLSSTSASCIAATSNSGTSVVDHNIIAEPMMGNGSGMIPVKLDCTSPATTTVSYNSIYLAGTYGYAIRHLNGNGTVNVTNNVMFNNFGGSPAATSAYLQNASGSGSSTYNTSNHWTYMAFRSAPINGTGDVQSSGSPFANTANFLTDHSLGLEATIELTRVGSDATTQRGANGASPGLAPLALMVEPTWPTVVLPS